MSTVGEIRLGTRDGSDRANGEAARPLRRRRSLPGGRAVVGAFLMTIAAIGVFAGYTNATADKRIDYLVARGDLTIGQRITRSSLGYLPMELPGLVSSRSFRDPDDLVGAVVLGPVAKGELIQASDVLIRGATPVGPELSFSIDSSRAVDGQLQRGEMVDVLVTYGTGNDAYTLTVARGVRVVNRRQPRGTLGDGRDEVVTVSVPSRAQVLALTHAVSAGAVTLVRTAGVPGDAAERPGRDGGASYRPPGPQEAVPLDDEAPPPAAPLD